MFGPDICGPKAMVHAIFSYNGTNYNLKKNVLAPKDTLTHTYTLVVKPDQTYEILVDSKSQASGSLLEDWDFLPPKEIKDPEATKPENWVDEAMIDDPTDVKPAGWDDIPEFIPDPEAKKPVDWDDDMDGEWEAPSVANSEFKGTWEPKQVANPDYKGPWEHPMVANPEYKVDNEIYAYDFGNVGIDVWQVKSGSIFDNILITDDVAEAEKIREDNKLVRVDEEGAKAKYDEKIQAEAMAKAEAEKPADAAAPAGEEEKADDLDLDLELEDMPAGGEEEIKEEIKEEVKEEAAEEAKEKVAEHVKDEL
jgi:calreticulin